MNQSNKIEEVSVGVGLTDNVNDNNTIIFIIVCSIIFLCIVYIWSYIIKFNRSRLEKYDNDLINYRLEVITSMVKGYIVSKFDEDYRFGLGRCVSLLNIKLYVVDEVRWFWRPSIMKEVMEGVCYLGDSFNIDMGDVSDVALTMPGYVRDSYSVSYKGRIEVEESGVKYSYAVELYNVKWCIGDYVMERGWSWKIFNKMSIV